VWLGGGGGGGGGGPYLSTRLSTFALVSSFLIK